MAGNQYYNFGLLCFALAFFAVWAVDLTRPAIVLSIMALMRWAVLSASWPMAKGGAA